MRYYIIGYPGCGKTTFAKWLSEKTGRTFVDVDESIELLLNTSIPTIFKNEGEARFREIEAEVLRSIKDEDAIVSCGGGLPCYKDNMSWMLENGQVIWLDVPLDIIKKRIVDDGLAKRPIMEKMAESGRLNEYIDIQYKEREPYYKKANIILNGKNFDFRWAKPESSRP